MTSINKMAASATLHCLTGCTVGEVVGMLLGTALGLSNGLTIGIATGLAFLSGYGLSALPLVRGGITVGAALRLVLAADTLSIIAMELADNTVMAAVPGAMNAGLGNVLFWVTMPLSLAVGFVVAFPVNRWLLGRGKGHALLHHD